MAESLSNGEGNADVSPANSDAGSQGTAKSSTNNDADLQGTVNSCHGNFESIPQLSNDISIILSS